MTIHRFSETSRLTFLLFPENVGLGDFRYGSPLIGQRIDWPLELMPQEIWPDMTMEFIPYMGQSFDAVKYPLLAQLHPANKLPADMRGYAPRGWDNARGIDTARVLMSSQEDAMQDINGECSVVTGGNWSITGAFGLSASSYNQIQGSLTGSVKGVDFKASRVARTAAETRTKNVAWNMIVRAK